LQQSLASDKAFLRWHQRNVKTHKVQGYASVVLSLKPITGIAGDANSAQMDAMAELSERFGFAELRVTHEQNIVLPDVRQDDLHTLWQAAKSLGLATPNVGLLTDMIVCPGGDFCALANAKSIPIAQSIAARVHERVDALDYLHEIGEITLNISGCINSCGHHHVGHIGILGVDKDSEEFYQISVGGNVGGFMANGAQRPDAIGKILGPSIKAESVPDAIEALIGVYLQQRDGVERFPDTVARIGTQPFKLAMYPAKAEVAHA
jgi:sulfite reductase (NADPH) hemoprotein beta-component